LNINEPKPIILNIRIS